MVAEQAGVPSSALLFLNTLSAEASASAAWS
jgi:hypothetical protein